MLRNIYVTLTALAIITTMSIAIEEYGVEGEDYEAGEVIVKFTKPVETISMDLGGICRTGVPQIDALNEEYGVYEMVQLFPLGDKKDFNTSNGKWEYSDFVEIRDEMKLGNVYTLGFNSKDNAAEVAKKYSALKVTEYAHPNGYYELCATPRDEFYNYQWNLHQSEPYSIKAENAWNVTTGDSDIVVAVIDTGVWAGHEDLQGRIGYGHNYVGPTGDTSDTYGHGTSVAGIIAANTQFPWDFSISAISGIAGIDDECLVIPLKVATGYYINMSNVVSAIYDSCFYFGVWIINMSLGSDTNYDTALAACIFAFRNGRLLVSGSGNDSDDEVSYPAAYSEVIAVGATNRSGYRYSYSNYGDDIELVAPAFNPSTSIDRQPPNHPKYRNRYYEDFTHTSSATPVVSGVAALLWAHHPGWSNLKIRKKLQGSTTIPAGKLPGWNRYTGYGIINATKALDAADKGGENDGTFSSVERSTDDTLSGTTIKPYLTSANPASGSVGIKFTSESGRYSVVAYDISGRKVEEWSGNGRDIEINWDVDALSITSGVYLIKVDTGKDISVLKTVIAR